MGIKNLNQFVRKECPEAIKTIPLNALANKVVVVDASIFIYRFIAEDALLENMYSMISLFQMHNIEAVFIFDGKPPEEKRKTLHKRTRLKRIAEMQYNRLISNDNDNDNNNDKKHAYALKMLRRRFIRIANADFERVKTLMRALGVQYIVASGEADALCAQMVIKRKAYACVSDDTDLFVHGCCRVLRHINLFDQTATMYDMRKILNILDITMTEFRQICVISGTDYNCGPVHGHNLRNALTLFKQYKTCRQDAEKNHDVFAPDFYTWLHHNCNNYNHRVYFDYDTTMAVYNIFDATNMINHVPELRPARRTRNDKLLHEVMAHENFIFV
jgi:5'-3' exonuclease